MAHVSGLFGFVVLSHLTLTPLKLISNSEMNKTDHERSSPMLPDLSLHIVDLKGSDKDVVDLGELLKVQVRMSDEDTYGIFVRNLIAKDNTGQNNLTLIDQSGCPVEAKFMREVRKMDRKGKSLESYFEAFSFTGSNSLQLEAEVETCIDQCKPVQCRIASGRSEDDGFEFVTSYGRRRRSAHEYGPNIKSRFLSKSINILAPQFKLKGPRDSFSESLSHQTPIIIRSRTPNEPDFFDFYKGLPVDDDEPSQELDEESDSFCFKPSTLTIISGITLLIQALFLTVVLIVRHKKKYSRHDTHKSDNLLTIY